MWAIRTHALRKIFLSIKGVYYECEVPAGQGSDTVPVRWLEPWEFKQTVPTDVDFRILLTFLDLYRTLTSFILYKLYTDENLLYPPPLDVKMDEAGEGVGKFRLVEKDSAEAQAAEKADGANGGIKKVTKKDVKKSIRSIALAKDGEADVDMDGEGQQPEGLVTDGQEDDFVYHPSKADGAGDAVADPTAAPLPTYTSLLASSASNPSTSNLLFSSYTFFLSRETSSRTWEFVIRSFGGKVLSLPSLETSPSSDLDTLTHIIIDRPMTSSQMHDIQGERKWTWVQPQWLADCVNQKKLLPSGNGSGYEPGGTLPPHLSPWEGTGEVERPWIANSIPKGARETNEEGVEEEEEMEAEAEEEEEVEQDQQMDTGAEDSVKTSAAKTTTTYPPALLAAAQNPTDSTLLHQAELEAESNGTDHGTFKKSLAAVKKAHVKNGGGDDALSGAKKIQKGKDGEEDLRKIMMTGKKQRLYEKMQYSNNAKKEEVSWLFSLKLLFDEVSVVRETVWAADYDTYLSCLQQDKLASKKAAIEKRKKKAVV